MASITTKARVSTSGSTSYQVQIRGKGVEKPYSKSFTDPVVAAKWASEQEELINGVASVPVEPIKSEASIAALFDGYMLSTQYKGGIQKKGYKTIESRMNILSRGFGDQDISTITEDDVRRYTIDRISTKAKNRNTNVTGSTVRKELELLKRLLNWAHERKGFTISVNIKGNLIPDAGKPRDKVISPTEYESMLEWCRLRCCWLEPMIILGWETAMRRGEIHSLVPRWINYKERCIKLPEEVCKNGEAREVPLSNNAIELLKRLNPDDTMKLDQPFFTIGDTAIPSAFKRMCRELKIEDAVFHSLRHTAITNYSKKPGMTLAFLARISGHKDLTMLSGYMHTESSFIADLMNQ
ncbi:site-specific integrase [Buttiauxella noackiae]|uniref:tyrosine-type recombinase/integrase n=1 Tax=Buttiauxella noackiae TaxID=82992 RepID=UPI0028D2F6FE|nr:site-specific integrase [Buttiauxella noackiae]